jgi:hypothetical protein
MISLHPTTEKFQVAADTLPPLNSALLAYVDAHRNKKVGNGECADLVVKGLQSIGATLPRKSYTWGTVVDSFATAALPGDILQFRNVVLRYTVNGGEVKETMQLHTAIIYEVKAPGVFLLAHQNVNGVRRLVFSDLDVRHIKKGLVFCYRPQ